MYHSLSIHLLKDHSYFQFLAIMNRVAINFHVQVFVWMQFLNQYRKLNSQECDCWVVWLDYIQFCKKVPKCLPKWLYHFYLPPPMKSSCCSMSLLEISSQFCVCFKLAILKDVQQYLIILFCNSLGTNDVEHLFIGLFTYHHYLQ